MGDSRDHLGVDPRQVPAQVIEKKSPSASSFWSVARSWTVMPASARIALDSQVEPGAAAGRILRL